MGGVPQQFNPIVKLELPIAFGRQAVNDHDPPRGFQDAKHLCERRGGLLHVVKGVLASDQVEASIGVGKLVGIAAIEKGVGNPPLAPEFPRLPKHLRCQVYSARETHAWRQSQDIFPRTAGHVEQQVGRLRLRKFHLLGENVAGITHRVF